MNHLICEQIARILSASPTGLRFEDIRHAATENESIVRFELKEMQSRGYVQKTGVTISTRYNLTPQGRLMFIANSEESIVEEFIAEQKPKSNTAEKIDEVNSESCNCEIDNGMTWCKSNENCRLPTPSAEIETKPYPFVTDSVIEDFETRIPQKNFFTELDDDSVFSPQHYNQGSIECIEALRACMSESEYQGFLRGNAIKYLWRLNDKATPQENLKKARWYIDTLAESFE